MYKCNLIKSVIDGWIKSQNSTTFSKDKKDWIRIGLCKVTIYKLFLNSENVTFFHD